MKPLVSFSKLTRDEKIKVIADECDDRLGFIDTIAQHFHPKEEIQKKYENFIENTLTNFFLPFGIAPNFLINDKLFHIPMVTEESSIVAAAASAAKFWMTRGGFHSHVENTIKKGMVHFEWHGDPLRLHDFFSKSKSRLINKLSPITEKMIARGGGIKEIRLLYKPEILQGYYQITVSFETVNAMGANFINTCLEELARYWLEIIENNEEFSVDERNCSIIMAILSNYNPECIVGCEIRAPLKEFDYVNKEMTGVVFAEKFTKAFIIAKSDISRAVTHNKGIFNGIDAVLLATGNDYRATEAGAHAYAARDGQYRSLSDAKVEENELIISLKLPLTIGTVGGLTTLHPMAQKALEVLGNPSAVKLMEIIAAVGIASNFNAVKTLVTTGIQKGHMKMHLSNILQHQGASKEEILKSGDWFSDKEVSYSSVNDYLLQLRKK